MPATRSGSFHICVTNIFLIELIPFLPGTIIDFAITILICATILLPIATVYGMDLAQLSIVLLISCAPGLKTPQVGAAQFFGCPIGSHLVGKVTCAI